MPTHVASKATYSSPTAMDDKGTASITALPMVGGAGGAGSGAGAGAGASLRRTSSSGISDDAAKTAHDFMAGTIRRSSSGVTDDAASAAKEFMNNTKGTGPGLDDGLADKMHKFMDGPATHRESHSKYLPDVTVSFAPPPPPTNPPPRVSSLCSTRWLVWVVDRCFADTIQGSQETLRSSLLCHID